MFKTLLIQFIRIVLQRAETHVLVMYIKVLMQFFAMLTTSMTTNSPQKYCNTAVISKGSNSIEIVIWFKGPSL